MYIEAKSFELLSKEGNISICFAETSIGIYQAVILGKSSGAIGSRDMKTYGGNLSMLRIICSSEMEIFNGIYLY